MVKYVFALLFEQYAVRCCFKWGAVIHFFQYMYCEYVSIAPLEYMVIFGPILQ
jgi:hypothetical protein